MSRRPGSSEAGFVPTHVRTWTSDGDNRAFLDATFDAFDRTAEWPRRPALQRELAAAGRSLNLQAIELNMPRELGFSDPPDQRTVLLTFGIYFCSGARPLLERYVAALKVAIARYKDETKEPTLTRADLSNELALNNAESVKLSRVLLREAPFLGSGSGDPSEWRREIHESIVAFFDVTTVEEYLALRARQLHMLEPEQVVQPGAASTGAMLAHRPSDKLFASGTSSLNSPNLQDERRPPLDTQVSDHRDTVSAVISWAHTGPKWTSSEQRSWEKTVLTFAELLRANGVDADLDLYQSVPTDWARWGTSAIQRSDYVLVVVSPAWKAAWHDAGEPTRGAGAVAEANVLHDLFRRTPQEFLAKVVLVLLPGASEDDIPEGLGATSQWVRVRSFDADGLEQLLRLLWNEPEHPKPPLGSRPELRPRTGSILDETTASDETRRRVQVRLSRIDDALSGLPPHERAERSDAPWQSAREDLESARSAASRELAELDVAEGPAGSRAFEADAGLSFGRAVIPKHSQPIHVFLPEMGGQPKSVGSGRIIRVPVVNAHGAREAKHLHARLTFLPNDRDGQFSPRDTAQGEWFSENGPEIEIDLPGNGRPRLLDVVVILDGEYPHAYEWTTSSRHAALRGYAIKANPIEIEIQVLGTALGPHFPHLRDELKIRLDNGMIAADWASAGPDQATNWVAWERRPSGR